MEKGSRHAQMLFGVILTLSGIGIAAGHYFAHSGHVPNKYEIMLSAGLIFVGGWMIVPYGMQGMVDTIRDALPFLDDADGGNTHTDRSG